MGGPSPGNGKWSHYMSNIVGQAISQIRQNCKGLYCLHYMDDILLAHREQENLWGLFDNIIKILGKWGLHVAPENEQTHSPITFLGH